MKNKAYFWFFSQALVSTIPSSFLFIAAPLVLIDQEQFLLQVGLMFLIIRFASMAGALNAARWHQYLSMKASLLIFEVFSILFLGALVWLKDSLKAEHLMVILGCRSYLIGVIQNTRNTWLKHLPDHELSTKISVNIAIAQQGAFFLIGLVLILFKNSPQLFWAMVHLDIASLFVSLALLTRFESLEIKKEKLKFFSLSFIKQFIVTFPKYFRLVFFSMFLAFGISGTNILLVSFGQRFISKSHGYGIAVCIYAVAFYLGAKLLDTQINNVHGGKWRTRAIIHSLSIVAALALIYLDISATVTGFALVIMFFFYGALFATQERIWFKSIRKEDATFGFASKEIMFGAIIAYGEWFYPFVIDFEILIRATSFALLAYITLLCFSPTKPQTKS